MKENNIEKEVSKKKILTIDPSGTGTTGTFFIDENTKDIEFAEFTSSDWKEQFIWIVNYIKEKQPDTIIYENTTYINLRVRGKGSDVISLFKLFGGLESLRFFMPFLQKIESIPVTSVKEFGKRLLAKEEWVNNLSYKVGRGGGWLFTHPNTEEVERLNSHKIDAYLIYKIYESNAHYKKTGKKKHLVGWEKRKLVEKENEEKSDG